VGQMVGWTAKRRDSVHDPGLLAEGVSADTKSAPVQIRPRPSAKPSCLAAAYRPI